MVHEEQRCIVKKTVTTRINCDVCGSVMWELPEDDFELYPDIDIYQLRNHSTGAERLDLCDECAGRLIQMARSGLLATAMKELVTE